MVNLEILDLGMNRIRKIEGLENLSSLQELWLGKNKIVKIEGLDALANLKRISIQSNRLTEMGNGLAPLINLEELYLSHQGIGAIEGLDGLRKLNTIDISHNRLTSTNGIPVDDLPELEDLWLNGNKISEYAEVDRLAPLGATLHTIYLQHNPLAKDFEYRKRVKATFAEALMYIDAVRCR